jgi:hypothetical protein
LIESIEQCLLQDGRRSLRESNADSGSSAERKGIAVQKGTVSLEVDPELESQCWESFVRSVLRLNEFVYID